MSPLPRFLTNDAKRLDFIWPSLKRAGYTPSEDDLLRAIDENKTKRIVHYAVLGLRVYGTPRSLSLLKKLAFYPMDDVKTSSVITVGIIAGESEAQFYAELLESPVYRNKMYPMIVLWEVGAKAALPSVIGFAKKVLGRKIKVSSERDVPYIIEYLEGARTPEADVVAANLHKIRIT